MGLPLGYSARNLTVRRSSTALTAIGIALTVAVFTGVVALYQGFVELYRPRGSETVGIYLRPGASSEGESGVTREQANIIIKESPEIAKNADGEPLAAAEMYLAVYMNKLGGGRTNVPLRGVQRMSLELHASGNLELVDGRWHTWGANEVVVGLGLNDRIENCRIGDTIQLNLTDFEVVGVFDHDGVYAGEIWGDVENMMTALERPVFQRIIAECAPGTDFAALDEQHRADKRAPLKFVSEREYLSSQTSILGPTLLFLAGGLIVIMGTAAILGSVITMLATVTARTHEIGVLLAIGFPRGSVFRAFLLESAFIGLLGGILGVILVAPFHGYQIGAMNWNTFTDVTFSYRLSPGLIGMSVIIAIVLGAVGGTIPALVAANKEPVDALRQG